MPSMSAVARLRQVASAVNGSNAQWEDAKYPAPISPKFQAGLPGGLKVNHTPLNPVSFLLRSATIHPDSVALHHPAREASWSYAEWAMRICALAYALKKHGIGRGDRVCVICPNVPMILDCIQALPAIHAIIVPMNIRLTKSEVDYILEHSGSKMIIVDHEFRHLVKGFSGIVVVSLDSGGKDASDPYESFVTEGMHDAETKGWEGLTLIDDEEAAYSLCYTSGTTGRPKGCLSTFRGTYLSALANVFHAEMTSNSVYLWILPAFHAIGWTYPLAITASSASQVCLRSVNDPSTIWESFLRDNVTIYCAAPTVQIAILSHSKARPLEHKIRTMVAGAAPSATLIQGLEKLNILVQHVYGLSETYGPFSGCVELENWKYLPRGEYYRLKAMQGHSYIASDPARVIRPGSSAATVYEDVKPDGKEIGEIIIRGNMVMQGYYNDPAATAKAFEGGYFHTGDLAVQEPHGAISIQDRSKDIIISGGENASSLFIESALFNHPDVLEVAVVARSHEQYGERAMAYVTLKEHSKSKWRGRAREFEHELKSLARRTLPGFARPEWVEIVDVLPKTSTGKIQKHELRKRFT